VFRDAAISDQLPTGSDVTYEIFVDGVEGYPEVRVQSVSGSYFQTLGIPLLEGAAFEDSALRNGRAQRVALVNRAFRDRFWPGASPVGQRFMAAVAEKPEWITVVGMVGNVRRSASDDPNKPQVFFPFFQQTQACGSLFLKTERPVAANVVRTFLWRTIDRYSVSDVAPLEASLHDQIWQPRLRAAVIGGFAAMALIFGAAAFYATLSQLVSMRGKDLAIRAALGARRGDLTRVVLSTYVVPIGVGFLLGVIGSFALINWISASVYGFEPLGLGSIVVVFVILVLTAVAATAIPAWRAEQIDVLPALRRS
jgi:putative ABC transport system permease protein